MPHFGRGTQINTCVKKLLLLFHDGVIWLGKPIHVTIELIASITSLPAEGMDPTPLLKKDQEAAIARRMKEKFGVQRSKRGFCICTINNPTIIFAVKLLASRLLRKMRPEQCTMEAIVLVYLCTEGLISIGVN